MLVRNRITGMIELFHIPAHIIVSSTSLLEYAAECFGVPNNPSYVPSNIIFLISKS